MSTYNKNVQGAPEHPIGPLIGTIIIIVVITLGGLYFWADHLHKEAKKQETGADEIRSIETELKKEDLEKLKTQINASTPKN